MNTYFQTLLKHTSRIQVGLMVLLFCVTPFLMSSQTTEIFEFNKMMFIYFISVSALSVWVISLAYRRSSQTGSLPWFVWLLAPFLIALTLSTWFSIDRHTSLFGYYGRWNGGLVSIISYILMSLVFYQSIGKHHLVKILQGSTGASVLVMLWGLSAKLGIDPSCVLFTGKWTNSCWTDQFRPAERMFSTIGQPNWLGAYLAISFFVACALFIIQQKPKNIVAVFQPNTRIQTMIYASYLVLTVLCIVFTKSRSSLISIGLGIMVWLGCVLYRYKKLFYSYVVVMLSVGVAVFMFRNSFTTISPLYEAPGVNQTISSSLDIRKIVWSGAWQLARTYPLFGTGPETFGYSYYFTRPASHNLTSEWDFLYNKAHNEYLNYAATTGFVGLFTYLVYICGVVVYAVRTLQRSQTPSLLNPAFYLLLSFMTILTTDFFGFSTSISHLFFFFIPLWIAIVSAPRPVFLGDVAQDTAHPAYLRHGIVALGCILWIGGFGYIYSYYQADILYSRAKIAASSSTYADAMTLLTDALKLRYEHVYEDKLSQVLAYIAFEISLKKNSDPRPIIALSEATHEKALRASPHNILYWKSRARNQFLYYQATHEFAYLQDALTSISCAVTLAQTDAQTRYAQAIIYQTMEKESKSKTEKSFYHARFIEVLNQTLRLKPNYIEVQKLLQEG